MNLDGKFAVVTGAASGIGRAIAVTLASAGAAVAVVDKDGAGVRATAASIGAAATPYSLDLADPAAILAFRDDLVAARTLPDLLVNAAGFDRVEPFMNNDDELWQTLTTVNYLGPVRLSHALLQPILAEGRTAKIVNIASDAGRVGSMGETVYSGTKGALIAFTKSLAREMARHRINVNCVCPGPTDTPLFATLPENIQTALIKAIPFRRLATPEEIADAVLFFCSEHSDYITGQVLSVSGGLTMAD
ncbi:MAG: SDR family NAD(P)-dependent oxidoreductase [Sporichthyaceae bacterium]